MRQAEQHICAELSRQGVVAANQQLDIEPQGASESGRDAHLPRLVITVSDVAGTNIFDFVFDLDTAPLSK